MLLASSIGPSAQFPQYQTYTVFSQYWCTWPVVGSCIQTRTPYIIAHVSQEFVGCETDRLLIKGELTLERADVPDLAEPDWEDAERDEREWE